MLLLTILLPYPTSLLLCKALLADPNSRSAPMLAVRQQGLCVTRGQIRYVRGRDVKSCRVGEGDL